MNRQRQKGDYSLYIRGCETARHGIRTIGGGGGQMQGRQRERQNQRRKERSTESKSETLNDSKFK